MTVLEIVCDFSSRLTEHGIDHIIGGSVASSVWGEPRQTNYADLEVWVNRENLDKFKAACAEPYFVSENEVQDSLLSTEAYRMVQVMHADEAFKIDCFLVSGDFAREGLARRSWVRTSEICQLPIASPEYILLRKLAWFKSGNRVSDRQWNDIRGLVQVQGDNLDRGWLTTWAAEEGVADLLARALNQN